VDYLKTPPTDEGGRGLDFWLIGSGAVLTFFSVIGFEDMLNVGEEVKNPRKTMPWGIVLALLATTVLYMAISITAVSVVDYHKLKDAVNGPPLKQITDKASPWLPTWVFSAITLFAVANTTLINFIMGSRLVYGMSRQGLLPYALGKVHRTRQTPHVAILVLVVMALVLVFAGDITQLASATSLLLLMVFCVVNSALVVLKFRAGEPKGGFEVWAIVPVLGVLSCLGLIAARMSRLIAGQEGEGGWKAPLIAGGLVLFISILYFVVKPKAVTEEMLAGAEEEKK
jgi:amino acid transporter